MAEKLKQRSITNASNTIYFWRNQKGGEVDFIEESLGVTVYNAYECKYSAKKAKMPLLFSSIYKPQSFTVINKENIVEYFTK